MNDTAAHPLAGPESAGPISAEVAVEVLLRQSSGVVVQAADGTITGFNPAALEMLHMTADQLTGATSLDPHWEAVDVELAPLTGEQHPAMKALRARTPVVDFIMGVRVGTGAHRWLRVDAWPIDTAQGQVVAQFTDITDELIARRQMADTIDRLQRHALPHLGLGVPWVRAEGRYQSLLGQLDIGGDFLDVFPIDDQRLGFFVGDACGHDLDTVTSMIIARHTLRAAGLHFNRPGQVLRWLDDLLRSTPDTVFCTSVYGTMTPAFDGGVSVVLANGGHPAPVVLRGDGPEVLHQHGSLLGALDHFVEPPTVEVHLAPGDRLVVYTDGLLESSRPRLEPDELVGHLATAAADLDASRLMHVVDGLIQRAVRAEGGIRDDMAVLVLTATGDH